MGPYLFAHHKQDAANPALVPRNHVMVGVIGEAEAGNYEPLRRSAAAGWLVGRGGSCCLLLLVCWWLGRRRELLVRRPGPACALPCNPK